MAYEVKSGTRTVVFLPLNLKALRTLAPEIEAMREIKSEDVFAPSSFDRMLKIFLASAKRANPDVTQEDIEEVIDTSNMLDVVYAIMNATGLKQAPAGGPTPAPTSPRIGGESMRASLAAQDGPSQSSTS